MSTHYLRSVSMSDRARMQESAKRRRLLEGVWEQDLIEAMSQYISAEQLAAWGRPSLSANTFRSVCTQLAVLYQQPPVLDHSDPTSAQRIRDITDASGCWSEAPQFQRLVIGQRECFRRLDWSNGRLQVRIVPVDLVTAESSPDRPSEPHTVHEYRARELDGEEILTRDVLSIHGEPVYRIETADGRQDLTERFLGQSYSGAAYPYRDRDGVPVLPYVLTHAVPTGKLFDAYEGSELVSGTLTVAALFVHWRHVVFDASWPQRYAINAVPSGLTADPTKEEHATFIPTDPASLLLLEPRNPDSPTTVGQFQPGGDPVTVGDAIHSYAAALAGEFDLTPADIARSHADSRSGYAIHVIRDSQRQASKRYETGHRAGDLQLLRIAAILHNRFSGEPEIAEDGYSIRYQPIPLSVEERKTRIEEYKVRAELGTASVVQFLSEMEGITEEEARERLEVIRQDRIRYGIGGQ